MRAAALFLVLSVVSGSILTACEKRTQPGQFKVALITAGSVGDGGWNQSAFAGIKRAQGELGASISNVETRGPAEYEETFRQYATNGYWLVVGHGFEFQDSALKVAPAYPKTTFLVTSGEKAEKNVVPLVFRFGEATYLAGMAAAAVSKSGKLGAIGGQAFPPVKDGFAAFEAGAKAINPQATLVISYVGNWEDAAAAKEAALAQIHTGVDVIIQNADAAGMGVFQAVRENAGVYAIGTNSNQNGVVADRVLGSAVNDVAEALVQIAKAVQSGSPPRARMDLGLSQNVVRFEPNAKLAALFASADAQMAEARKKMNAGHLTPPKAGVETP